MVGQQHRIALKVRVQLAAPGSPELCMFALYPWLEYRTDKNSCYSASKKLKARKSGVAEVTQHPPR